MFVSGSECAQCWIYGIGSQSAAGKMRGLCGGQEASGAAGVDVSIFRMFPTYRQIHTDGYLLHLCGSIETYVCRHTVNLEESKRLNGVTFQLLRSSK